MLAGNGRWADVVLGGLEIGKRKANALSAQGKEGKEGKKKKISLLPLVLTCMHADGLWKSLYHCMWMDGQSTDASDYGS